MIRHAEMTPALVLEEMRRAAFSDGIRRVGGPSSPADIAEATESLAAATADPLNKVLIVCAGCEGSVPILESACCVCGGFICPACQQLEGEGACTHEVPDYPD